MMNSIKLAALIACLAAVAIAAPSPCPRAIKMDSNYKFRGTLHFICLQATGGMPRLDVIQYADRRVIQSIDVTEPDVDQMASFVDESGALRILLAVPNRLNGTSMYSVDPTGQVINETHTINTQFVSALSIWRMELNSVWHLAIANQPTYDFIVHDDNSVAAAHQARQVPDPQPMISLLSWRSTYFDSYQLIYLPEDGRVNKLEPMHINGQEFLIVAMESANRFAAEQSNIQPANGQGADSLIYKLDFGDGSLKWTEYQQLSTQIAFDARSFYMTHKNSLQREYYIAVIGQAKAAIQPTSRRNVINVTSNHFNDNNYEQQSSDYGLMIYKYFGDHFERTQHSVAAPSAVKLDTITYGNGDSYVIIALLSGGGSIPHLNLYLYDGLMLKLMPGQFGKPPPPPPPTTNQLRYPSYLRQRRTMENSASLHLFMAPSAAAAASSPDYSRPSTTNDSIQQRKRTLTDDTLQSLTMPALALSTADFAQYENADNLMTVPNDTDPIETESVYHIPINEMIKSELERQFSDNPQLGGGYEKRSFVGSGADMLLNWCTTKIGELLADNFQLIARHLAELPRIDQVKPIELMGNLIVEDDLHVSNMLYARQIREIPDTIHSLVIEQPPAIDPQTFEQIQQKIVEIQQYEQQVDRILVDDGTIQEVYSPLAFDTLYLECPGPIHGWDPKFLHSISGARCPYVNEIRTTRLNSRNITNIQQQALLVGRPMVIHSDVRFEHLVLRGKVSILDTLNGLAINDIVFKRGPSTGRIVGHKHFVNGLYSSSNIGAPEWHGAQVDAYNYLTSTGLQRIEAGLHFAQVIVDSVPMGMGGNNMSSRVEKLNGIHLDTHLDQIALADDNNNFEAPIHFDELILNGPIKLPEASRLCQVDVENVWLNTMFKESNQNITAPMHFSGDVHVSYGGNIVVDGLINGMPFQPDLIWMRDTDRLITNPIIFDSDVSIRDLTLDKSLNGIQVLGNPVTGAAELAVLYNGGNQAITGDKVFQEVHLGGQSHISGNVNGRLNITDLHRIANALEPHYFHNLRLFGGTNGTVRVANGVDLHVSDSINGYPTNDLCALANRIAQSSHLAFKRLKFGDPIGFKSLRCASINGFNDLTRSFLTKGGNQHVAGHLKLMNGVLFNTSLSIQTALNSMQIAPLADAIARTVNESRSGHKDVRGDLVLDELFADRIGNFELANILLARSDEPQYIRAPMTFDQLTIENILHIGGNLFADTFNGLNITDILANSLQYDTPQVVYNHVQLGTLQLLANSSFATKSLNGHDLQRLYADSVLKDVPQQIAAPKTFRAPAEFANHVGLKYGIDELSADELRFNLELLGSTNNLIEGDVDFANDVSIKNGLEIRSGMINEIDLRDFVDSMIYENRSNIMRINGSVYFKDAKVSNLVLGGRIQGIDLSREAALKSDNLNGSLDARIREQQALINNQRLLNTRHGYGPGSSFRVLSNYKGADHQGTCLVHSCAPAHNSGSGSGGPAPMLPAPWVVGGGPPTMLPPWVVNTMLPPWVIAPRPSPQAFAPILQQAHWTWKPIQQMVGLKQQQQPQQQQQLLIFNQTAPKYGVRPLAEDAPNTMQLIDPKFLEHKSIMQAQAITDLAYRINRFLSSSFYYEIVHKHPLLGPLLHATSNPALNEQHSAQLLLKGTSKPGEPCLSRGQTIAVHALQKQRHLTVPFAQSSLIQGTSNPTHVDSASVGHYLFVLDSHPAGVAEASAGIAISQVIIYAWDHRAGMYELKQSLVLNGYPTAMKAFNVGQIACVALANPAVIARSNQTGAPTLYCQHSPQSMFALQRTLSPAPSNVFDLDIVGLPHGSQFVMATLSQQHTEQIGDLSVGVYDLAAQSWTSIKVRRMVRPMKLHFFRDAHRPLLVKLAVSEAITSCDDAQALTRIFALKLAKSAGHDQRQEDGGRIRADASQFYETQVLKDNQFHDIQSVHLDAAHTMLFLQSAHSISIYAPANMDHRTAADCDHQYSLVQRLPTKGANKFLVFNDRIHDDDSYYNNNNNHTLAGPFDHFLVLSKDNCEQQQHSATIILKAKFV